MDSLVTSSRHITILILHCVQIPDVQTMHYCIKHLPFVFSQVPVTFAQLSVPQQLTSNCNQLKFLTCMAPGRRWSLPLAQGVYPTQGPKLASAGWSQLSLLITCEVSTIVAKKVSQTTCMKNAHNGMESCTSYVSSTCYHQMPSLLGWKKWVPLIFMPAALSSLQVWGWATWHVPLLSQGRL